MSKRAQYAYKPMTKAELIAELAGIPDNTKIILSCPVMDVDNGNIKYDEEATAITTLYFPEDKELYIMGEAI